MIFPDCPEGMHKVGGFTGSDHQHLESPWVYIFHGLPFPCDGNITAFELYSHLDSGTIFAGIWRQNDPQAMKYTLEHKTQIDVNKVGLQTV